MPRDYIARREYREVKRQCTNVELVAKLFPSLGLKSRESGGLSEVVILGWGHAASLGRGGVQAETSSDLTVLWLSAGRLYKPRGPRALSMCHAGGEQTWMGDIPTISRSKHPSSFEVNIYILYI